MVLLALVSLPFYPGDALRYVAFQGASIALALSAFRGHAAYGFTAFSIFLLLGFWLKATLLTLGLDPLIEPIGGFNGSADAWDAALDTATIGLGAVAGTGFLWVAMAARRARPPQPDASVPVWFVSRRRVVWVGTCLVVVAGALANWIWRIYVVGVDVRFVLPFRLNVAIAWWLTVASGMWIAVLLEWEHRLRPHGQFARWLVVPVVEAFVTSTVMLSRGFYVMKLLPYALVLLRGRARRDLGLRSRPLLVLTLIAAVGFGGTLVAVSWLRLEVYPTLVLPAEPRAVLPPPAAPRAPGTPSVVPVPPGRAAPVAGDPARDTRRPREARAMARQVMKMIAGRWIGLEGVMAVTSWPSRDRRLWLQALAEEPGAGNAALYQRIARATYKPQPGVTFLTLPGVLAVMAYAGAPIVIVLGMILVTLLLLATEALCRSLHRSELLCAVVGVAMANVLAQMNFPYLTAVFVAELWMSLAVLRLLSSGLKFPGGASAPIL